MIERWLARADYPQSPAHLFVGFEPLSVCGRQSRHAVERNRTVRSKCRFCAKAAKKEQPPR